MSFTPEPGGYFFVHFSYDTWVDKVQTTAAFATYEEALAEAATLRFAGHTPRKLCYVGPYKGKSESTLPIVIVENWE